tara:strand:+ start:616 stop:1005 length:390 start_codon:yes stop_codon:yes gene_type:complete
MSTRASPPPIKKVERTMKFVFAVARPFEIPTIIPVVNDAYKTSHYYYVSSNMNVLNSVTYFLYIEERYDDTIVFKICEQSLGDNLTKEDAIKALVNKDIMISTVMEARLTGEYFVYNNINLYSHLAHEL